MQLRRPASKNNGRRFFGLSVRKIVTRYPTARTPAPETRSANTPASSTGREGGNTNITRSNTSQKKPCGDSKTKWSGGSEAPDPSSPDCECSSCRTCPIADIGTIICPTYFSISCTSRTLMISPKWIYGRCRLMRNQGRQYLIAISFLISLGMPNRYQLEANLGQPLHHPAIPVDTQPQ